MIGIFDSGSGGLTVMRAIREVMPDADIVYFGDTKHAPYGIRSRSELSKLTVAGFRTLTQNGATHIVSACNSVSASLALALLDLSAIPPSSLIEMVGPTVRSVVSRDYGRVALAATEATIGSGLYTEAFEMFDRKIVPIAIPALAGAIEAGEDETTLTAIITEAFSKEVLGTFDTLVLACTHYPLVLPLFERILGPSIRIIDPARAVAEETAAHFGAFEHGTGRVRFLLSEESAAFRTHASRLFPSLPLEIEVLQ